MPNKKRKAKQGGGLLISEAMLNSVENDELRERVSEEELRLSKIRQDARKQAVSEVIGKVPGGSGPPSWAISLLAKFLGRDDPTKDSSNQKEKKAGGGLLDSDRQQYAMGDEVVAADIPMPEEDIAMPMPQEEMAMAPDDEMEDNYLDFVVSESLNPDEQNYLMEALTADENLSIIFDKLMNTATEFAGSGPVEGPGSAVSDSIPARLSDGEFVLTSKATDEIGPDNIQAMMKDAEARSDQRQMAQEGGVIREDLENLEDTDAIKQGMLSVNPRMRTG